MIDLYYFPTPNAWKITIMLEECGLPYKVVPVNLRAGDQHKQEFLALNPNNKIPVIVDRDASEGPQTVFESGAILIYLAEKAGRFMPSLAPARTECLEWLFWQVGNLGPMFGQLYYFRNMAPEKVPVAIDRYQKESERLLNVMSRQLAQRDYLAGEEYSIADMACFGWAYQAENLGVPLTPYPGVKQWHDRLVARPAVQRGIAVGV